MRLRISIALSLAFALLSGPAQAHDLLIDISPAPGDVVSSSSFEAVLTFDNPLLAIDSQSNAELATKLVGSSDWTVHPITIDDRTLVAQVTVAEAGSYDLRWSVVGSDGHPISGESSFVLESEPVAGELEPVVTSIEPVTASGSQDIPAGFYVGLILVGLGAVFAPIGLMIRRRSKKS
jgi:methionine-rich copper-binding protein CopC